MVAYASLPLLLVVRSRLILIATLTFVAFQLFGLPWWGWTAEAGWARCLPAFALGLGLHDGRDRLRRLLPSWSFPCAAAALATALIARVQHPVLMLFVVALVATALAADTAGAPGRVVDKIAPLGQLTYGVYMLHPLVEKALLGGAAVLAPGLGAAGTAALVAVAILTTFVLAYVGMLALERPARAWITRAMLPRDPEPVAAPLSRAA